MWEVTAFPPRLVTGPCVTFGPLVRSSLLVHSGPLQSAAIPLFRWSLSSHNLRVGGWGTGCVL